MRIGRCRERTGCRLYRPSEPMMYRGCQRVFAHEKLPPGDFTDTLIVGAISSRFQLCEEVHTRSIRMVSRSIRASFKRINLPFLLLSGTFSASAHDFSAL